MFFAHYRELFTQAEVTLFANIIVWFTFPLYSPFDDEGFFPTFKCPNVLP